MATSVSGSETIVQRRVATPEGESQQESPEKTGDDNSSTTGCLPRRFRRGSDRPKSRRPPSNKWLQQQIPACRPVFTAKYVFGLFVIVGIVFLILGIVFVAATVGLRELEVEYTNCGPLETDDIQASSCEDYLRNISDMSNSQRRFTDDCHCTLLFEVKDTMRYPWKFYYALDNYYQNHRRYLNSWDPAQLRGDNFRSPDSNCRPLVRYRDNAMNDTSRRPIVPCGIIANSWFNDSFHYLHNEDLNETIDLSRNNIAWETDREVRFRNDSNLAGDLDGTNAPPNWPYNVSEIGDGLGNESLIVWFRVSAFPWFRKLYAHPRGDRDLPPGNYSLLITYNYPVDNFRGRKSIFISELSWLGGRNLFLGIAYIITAVVSIVTGIVLLVIHLFFSKWRTSDPNYLKREY